MSRPEKKGFFAISRIYGCKLLWEKRCTVGKKYFFTKMPCCCKNSPEKKKEEDNFNFEYIYHYECVIICRFVRLFYKGPYSSTTS